MKKEDATTEKSSILSEILSKSKLPLESKSTTTIKVAPDGGSVATSTTEKTKSIHEIFAKSAVEAALLPTGYKNGI